jgi:NDP-mannose synthase
MPGLVKSGAPAPDTGMPAEESRNWSVKRMKECGQPFRAVILAGGPGRRLYPLTESIPKPLLPSHERPVIELIVRRLVHFGASQITVAISHLADQIETFLGDGKKFGIPIDYVREVQPLGTAGSIRLIAPWEGPLVVRNGDILCDIDFHGLLGRHCKVSASLSIASKARSLRIDEGVITTDDLLQVTGIVEKPLIEQRISLGIYVMSEHVRSLIPPNQRMEMPELIEKLISLKQPVFAYDHVGVWLDIGRPDDLAKAQADATMWMELINNRWRKHFSARKYPIPLPLLILDAEIDSNCDIGPYCCDHRPKLVDSVVRKVCVQGLGFAELRRFGLPHTLMDEIEAKFKQQFVYQW